MPSDPMSNHSAPNNSQPSDQVPSDLVSSDSAPGDAAPEFSPFYESLPSEPIPGSAASENSPAAETADPEDSQVPAGSLDSSDSLVSRHDLATEDSSDPSDSPVSRDFLATADSSEPSDSPVSRDNLDPAHSSAPTDSLTTADSLSTIDSSTTVDGSDPVDSPSHESIPDPPENPGSLDGPVLADSLAAAVSSAEVFGDKDTNNIAESVSDNVISASEEIAAPIAPLPENQEPAPAQITDLRQIADHPTPPLAPELLGLTELSPPPLQRQIPIATAAPLVAPAQPKATKPESATAADSNRATALPLQLINQLLRKIGATPLVSLVDMLPLLRILTLAVLAGITLKLATATLGAIDDLPLVGGLLELVVLVTLLNFLARNAFKQKKRAELLARIQKLRTDLLGQN